MAINIFQGGKTTSKSKTSSKTNSASRTSRAQKAQSMLVTPSAVSDSGNVAVSKSGTLPKVGKVIGEVAGIASKFLPGIGGTIAKGISNIFNDPEWWQHVPGDAVTLNEPLRVVESGDISVLNTSNRVKIAKPRYTMITFNSFRTDEAPYPVMKPTDTMVVNYLMPEIRKVVNAVPLQAASDYRHSLEIGATVYAIWQTLKKCDYILKHGQTYMASLDDPSFPVLQTSNAAWLQSTINRLEEFLRSHIRLPHTLCEYLAWRYGRVYKSCASAKAGLVMYNALNLSDSIDYHNNRINTLINYTSTTPELQKATADLFNTYFDHDQMVVVAEHTQYQYDAKEFCLRTNSDVVSSTLTSDSETPDAVYIDSTLDNPTTFMASTVSTLGWDGITVSVLFPITGSDVWLPRYGSEAWYIGDTLANGGTEAWSALLPTSNWRHRSVTRVTPGGGAGTCETFTSLTRKIQTAAMLKALDVYNKDIYVLAFDGPSGSAKAAFDLTALSMDMGSVPSTMIANEHVYAFANLVSIERKRSMSYKTAETLVARDTANLVDTLDIAVSGK